MAVPERRDRAQRGDDAGPPIDVREPVQRTDAGVHATGQVANFVVDTRMTPEQIGKALAIVEGLLMSLDGEQGGEIAEGADGIASALAMPELSLAPQVAAGLSVVAWRAGHRKLALVPVLVVLVAWKRDQSLLPRSLRL